MIPPWYQILIGELAAEELESDSQLDLLCHLLLEMGILVDVRIIQVS